MKQLHLDQYHTDADFPLGFFINHGGSDFPLHQHNFTELVIILDGRGVHFTADDEYQIGAGDVFVVSESIQHGYHHAESVCMINLMFNLAKLLPSASDLYSLAGFQTLFKLEPNSRRTYNFRNRLQLTAEALSLVENLSLSICSELRQRKAGYKTLCMGRLYELLVLLSRYTPANPSVEFQTLRKFGKIISHLETHYDSCTFSVNQLAAMANMSRRTFLRSFKKATGCSPIQYLIALRLEKAKELLLNNRELRISDIALQVGFHDSNYFSRLFRDHCNCSPRLFRQ